jgi:hypothetical protein
MDPPELPRQEPGPCHLCHFDFFQKQPHHFPGLGYGDLCPSPFCNPLPQSETCVGSENSSHMHLRVVAPCARSRSWPALGIG